MPLELTTPENRAIRVVQSVSATHYHVIHLGITIDPNDASKLMVLVQWAEGYMDESTFVQIEQKDAVLSGQDVLDKVNETTDGTTSVYNNVKQRVWEMLQAAGLVPAGTIS